MAGAVKESASHSQYANNLALKTSQTAQEGGAVLNRTVTAMQEVSESSKKINDIINVVNEIAFQTNLLALNAAVEAARAGEAGRGFAVVAGEVRNLAGRSANAAKEIQTLITDSVDKVEHGNQLVRESGELLSKIIADAEAVVGTIGEISNSAQEQASAIEEINKAMSQMDSGIQQNAAMVEEIASATEQLHLAADNAREQVSQFITQSQPPQQTLLGR
jgi:methyl-accepting chemotaxis protein